jgi:hypothetical protein
MVIVPLNPLPTYSRKGEGEFLIFISNSSGMNCVGPTGSQVLFLTFKVSEFGKFALGKNKVIVRGSCKTSVVQELLLKIALT